MKKEILDHHIIYGEWDDCLSNQFLVYSHPNGIDCVVFIMNGIDYGGGISYWFNSKSEIVNKIVSQKDKYDGDIKREIEALHEKL
ncbi:MAG: hypothetical protein ABIJ17_03200 [Patescibacteria group bacterium]